MFMKMLLVFVFVIVSACKKSLSSSAEVLANDESVFLSYTIAKIQFPVDFDCVGDVVMNGGQCVSHFSMGNPLESKHCFIYEKVTAGQTDWFQIQHGTPAIPTATVFDSVGQRNVKIQCGNLKTIEDFKMVFGAKAKILEIKSTK